MCVCVFVCVGVRAFARTCVRACEGAHVPVCVSECVGAHANALEGARSRTCGCACASLSQRNPFCVPV